MLQIPHPINTDIWQNWLIWMCWSCSLIYLSFVVYTVIAVYLSATPVAVYSTLVTRRPLYQSWRYLDCSVTDSLCVPICLTIAHWPTHGNSEQVRLRHFRSTLHLCFMTVLTAMVPTPWSLSRTSSVLVRTVLWPASRPQTDFMFSFWSMSARWSLRRCVVVVFARTRSFANITLPILIGVALTKCVNRPKRRKLWLLLSPLLFLFNPLNDRGVSWLHFAIQV